MTRFHTLSLLPIAVYHLSPHTCEISNADKTSCSRMAAGLQPKCFTTSAHRHMGEESCFGHFDPGYTIPQGSSIFPRGNVMEHALLGFEPA